MTSSEETAKELKFSKLENPNRIYFDIDNSVLIGGKQQLVFDKATIKEIRLSQFTTNPDVVRAVITFEEGFDTSKVKLINLNGNILERKFSALLVQDFSNAGGVESLANICLLCSFSLLL